MIPELQSKLRVNPQAEESAAMAFHIGMLSMFVFGVENVHAALASKAGAAAGRSANRKTTTDRASEWSEAAAELERDTGMSLTAACKMIAKSRRRDRRKHWRTIFNAVKTHRDGISK
jgi:hypothetical protein